MIPLERQRTILRLLEEHGSVSISTLVSTLGVSHMTVRRDIHRLEELGRVVSVAGGVTLPARLEIDQSHTVKEGLQRAEKAAIAEAAADLVDSGDVVFLDAGTTTLAVARLLAGREGLTFVTNDLAIATLLSDGSSNELYLVGGRMDRANLSSEGAMAAGAIAGFNIDVGFMSTSSFDLRGTSVPTGAKLLVKRAIAENSSRTILVSDSTKYGKVASLRAIRLTDLNGIVSDAGLTASAAERITELGIPLTLAEPRERATTEPRKDHA